MASRFNQRDARSALFSSYDAQARSRPGSGTSSPGLRSNTQQNAPYHNSSNGSPYGLSRDASQSHLSAEPPAGAGFSAYPSGSSDADAHGAGFRPATPNRKGQYSGAVLDELESQNEEQMGEMAKRVRMLKDITVAIGDEIRDSTKFAETMNDQFEGTRNRLRGTMNRMLLMAKRTGIGWKIWLGFFAFVSLLFFYVWLF